ncbi:mitochondrial 54S ribosomal protein mL50 MRPL13 Ecym_6129 [Eremothecium cymbalariae DBVPG|uniref:Large ribosomal subunit protein mL50 n=1 Tax=Eremothecium cymbalariae (strain CBS 270.75 / DBVPG 7215 / KCTC 17166 / NRRL Y-17582) TaxID=931890 RepID=G8JV42_ERECY|nr:hypothetical protein Ecym_6129 [Eremothecium cymbalariae DBVPG\
MGLRRQYDVVKSVRYLHSSGVRQDIISWLTRKKQPPKEEVKDVKEVMNSIESGSTPSISEPSGSARLSLTNDDFIGVDVNELERKEREEMLKSTPFNQWLRSRKVSSEQELYQIALDAYKVAFEASPNDREALDRPFPDLVSKFKFSKYLQSKTGYMLPDYKLTTLSTPLKLVEWYEVEVLTGKRLKFNEAEPNAIDLSNVELPANVYVDQSATVKDRKRTFNKILREVEALESGRLQQAIEKAKND